MKHARTSAALAALTCAFSLGLTGCGGGGGDDTPSPQPPPPTPQATAEGFWNGTAASGKTVHLFVLENGEAYGMGMLSGSIVSGTYGNTISNGGKLSGSMWDFSTSTPIESNTFTGSFIAKSSINMQFSNGGTYSASYDPLYDQPQPSLSTIAGTYTGNVLRSDSIVRPVTVIISSSGGMTIPTSQGCGASGTINPRASGKNILDVALTFQGDNCVPGNGGTVYGIAIYSPATSYAPFTPGLLVIAATADKTIGFIFTAAK